MWTGANFVAPKMPVNFHSSPQQLLKSGLQGSTLALSSDKRGTYWGKVYIIKYNSNYDLPFQYLS